MRPGLNASLKVEADADFPASSGGYQLRLNAQSETAYCGSGDHVTLFFLAFTEMEIELAWRNFDPGGKKNIAIRFV